MRLGRRFFSSGFPILLSPRNYVSTRPACASPRLQIAAQIARVPELVEFAKTLEKQSARFEMISRYPGDGGDASPLREAFRKDSHPRFKALQVNAPDAT